MEFFLLFIFNIFTGAVIYLILSLKIERTTSTFHEKKLRKEMGEIITEFNATAERNITLLESRISILKKLLNDKGDFRGVDVIVDEGKIENRKYAEVKKSDRNQDTPKRPQGPVKSGEKSVSVIPPDKNDGSILVGLIDKITHINNNAKGSSVSAEKGTFKKNRGSGFDITEDTDVYSPEFSENRNEDYFTEPPAEEDPLQEDISLLFRNSSDKYTLIKDLHSRGYTVDDISRHSGLPSGEVRLVISLSS